MADRRDERTEEHAEVEHLRAMLASAPAFITRATLDGRLLYVNRLAPGFTMDQVIGTSLEDYVPEESRPRMRDAMRRAVETRETQTFEGAGRISSDRYGHYVSRISPIIEDDVVASLVMVATDVTEVVGARDTLRDSQAQLQLALDATGMGIWTYDLGPGNGSWDVNTRRIFGVDGEVDAPDLMKMLGTLIHADDRKRVGEEIERGLSAGTYGPIEHRIVTPDGSVRWVAASGSRIERLDAPPCLVGSIIDITERRAFEARLLEAEKLESIGRLAGGIAHDFNNMLTAMIVNVDLLLRIGKDPRSLPMLQEIRLAAKRSAALTTQLLAFARRQVIEPRMVDPNELAGRLDALLRRVIGEHIEMASDLRATGQVRIDPSQLEQILLNLATNARDAMPAGGRLTVGTSDLVLDEARARLLDVAPGAYVMISVQDSGHGIPPDALAHVFEPFFSTRPGGTGLGLATCYGIARQNLGQIAVQSDGERGTRFEVYLPAQRGETEAPADEDTSSPTRIGGESVLLVEDEELVRKALGRTLESAGYRVQSFGSPLEALEAFDRAGPFDVLVTDMVMPGMSGRELAARVTERSPSVLVLCISGYTESVVDARGTLEPGVHFLQKPFPPDVLLGAVRALLDARSPSR